MSKISVNELSFYYGDYYYPIFHKVNLVMDTDWKLGLIGRNGRGKTTLLHLLQGKLVPTGGSISMSVSMEYFPYMLKEEGKSTLDMLKENMGGLKSMEDRMEEILEQGEESAYEEYSLIQEEYCSLGGYEAEGRILKELHEMGLHQELLRRPFHTLSGGEKTRMMILLLFLRKDSFVLLDEPTNHLDTGGKEALISYLRKKKGFIVVSHDREFLDQVIDHVLSINKQSIEIEQGTYTSWKQNKDMREQFELRTKVRIQKEVVQLERLAEENRSWAKVGNKQKYAFNTNARSNGAKSYMRQAKRSEEQILRSIEEKKQLLRNYEEADELYIIQEKGEGERLIQIRELSFRYPGSPRDLFKDLDLSVCKGERIWIRGKNGAGKSTLLRLIAGKISSEGIEYGEDITISMAEQEPLWTRGRLTDRFQNEGEGERFGKFMDLLKRFDLPEDILERPLETLSSGELKKVDAARALSEERMLILFDEPLNYMDVYFREQLEQAVLVSKPTMVFVEHDSYFGSHIATREINL